MYTQVQQSDCVAAILHVIHMTPWVRHQSVHKDTFSKLVRQRAAESKAIACFASYMEQETTGLQVRDACKWEYFERLFG